MRTMNPAIEAVIPALRRYARALLGSAQDADDLVHDSVILALANVKPQMPHDAVRPWLFTIMRHRFISDRRKAKFRHTVPLDDAALGGDAPMFRVSAHQESGLRIHDLSAGLASLPDEMREVLLLVTLENFTYAEVAAMLDVPLGTVMSRLSRARDRLGALMDGATPPLLRRIK
ncbi:RNA polymerase sigma factor [Acidiphilium iwatense]|uniref:RNA polymerase sigma factor n=2 Tax=Acidiphilium iwatense TaxID=768198 RepID=A0ABS9E0X9_9PROT|nr:RNA polymerase sigma factor [Acidiphilium iwatense]